MPALDQDVRDQPRDWALRSSSGAFAVDLEGPVGDDGRDQRAEQDDQAKGFCDEAADRPHQP